MSLLFLKVMFAEFIAEMGDKTQLMLIAMTSKFKLRDIIIGTLAAILVLNGLAVAAGNLAGSLVPEWLIKLLAAAAFVIFALISLKDDDEEEEGKSRSFAIAPVAVFITFFLAELGDKTQLTAITFGASEGKEAAVAVWLACSAGLFAADIIGLIAGYILHSRLPARAMNYGAFLIFGAFGAVTAWKGIVLLLGEGTSVAPVAVICICVLLAAALAVNLVRSFRRPREL